MYTYTYTHIQENTYIYAYTHHTKNKGVYFVQYVAVLYTDLQCDAVSCCMLQCTAYHVGLSAELFVNERRIRAISFDQCLVVALLQCVTMCYSAMQCVQVWYTALQRLAECCSVLQCVKVCCSVSQRVAGCCNVDQHLVVALVCDI